MKKTIVGLIMLSLMFSLVSANPFSVDKSATVTGDWFWDNGWTQPTPAPETAWYNFHADSTEAKTAWYTEIEEMGTAWQYDLENDIGTDASGTVVQELEVVTVNDPTLPEVDDDGYTTFGFESLSQGKYSTSSLAITGWGEAFIGVRTDFHNGFQQHNTININ